MAGPPPSLVLPRCLKGNKWRLESGAGAMVSGARRCRGGGERPWQAVSGAGAVVSGGGGAAGMLER